VRAHPRKPGYDYYRKGGYITGTVDTKEVDKLIRKLHKGKEGRKLIRQASRVALELFNEETAEQVSQLDLTPSGKKWRKEMKKKGSYAYRAKMSGDRYHFWTGVNYKKTVLRITHLVNDGFKHKQAGKIAGFFFREKAFELKRAEVMRRFKSYMERGIDIIRATGKAPGLKTLRGLTR